ncbi:MAG TPA: hypothetical protein VHP33_01110 [Polyangiaceae bacterium]|nr:hypothetical protein [Polyangiaceae bacterium]
MPRVRPQQRRLERWARLPCALLLGWLHACSLVVSTESLQEGCPADRKPCGGVCVSRADPDFGCDADSCRPCVIAHATARCSGGGVCVVASCQGEFADCNADGDSADSDGCEIDTAHDADHCGACDATPCSVPNGAPDCAGGICSIRQCDDGYRDCNFEASDGCERRLAHSSNCE